MVEKVRKLYRNYNASARRVFSNTSFQAPKHLKRASALKLTVYLWPSCTIYVTKKRDRKAALRFLKKAMKRYGRRRIIVTDRLRSYGAAMKVIGNTDRQVTGRWLNNRAENSHQPFRRRERAKLRFRSAETLQKFASVHSSIHNHFNLDRHLTDRSTFKLNRIAAENSIALKPASGDRSPFYPCPSNQRSLERKETSCPLSDRASCPRHGRDLAPRDFLGAPPC
jgi:putative transposase